MKACIFIILSLTGALVLSFQVQSTVSTQTIIAKIIIDSLPDTLFYDLTAQQITTMPNTEIKSFCAKRNISLSKFVLTRVKAENYLLEKQIKCDSIEVVRIYERIDKRLGIDK